jgi:tRNA(Ile)-lysidine synthetase-like protein
MAALGNPWPGAVAVSGGGDSVALMHLLADWARARNLHAPKVLTVDHGLTSGSKKRASEVKAQATRLGLSCEILSWKGSKPRSDVEAAAREARYRLMGEWCRANGIAFLYVAHSQDDQAETFLLRLARGSGLDGLSAMRSVAPFPLENFSGLSLVRPLLDMTRDELRRFLAARAVKWHEDPMNTDPRYARVRFRLIRPVLEEAGLSAARIAAAARHLRRARGPPGRYPNPDRRPGSRRRAEGTWPARPGRTSQTGRRTGLSPPVRATGNAVRFPFKPPFRRPNAPWLPSWGRAQKACDLRFRHVFAGKGAGPGQTLVTIGTFCRVNGRSRSTNSFNVILQPRLPGVIKFLNISASGNGSGEFLFTRHALK